MARGAADVKREPKPWAGEAEATGSVAVLPRPVQEPPMPAPFVAKTYELVADAATNAVVSWAPGGAGNNFVAWDPQALAVSLLPHFFKHANFASFIRQLNIYAVDVEEVTDPSKNLGSDSLFNISKHSNQRRCDDVLLHNYQNGSLTAISGNNLNLFAFPSECNFSGHKFNPSLVKLIKEGKLFSASQGRWMVLLDAAKGCTTEPPNLTMCPADFVVCSFYKIFGYPTGLGALIVKNVLCSNASDALDKLRFLGVTDSALLADGGELEIRIKPHPDAGTITITDTGVGMTKYELKDCLGTIAQTGTSNFLKALKENKDLEADNGLIGQFGVGFYSAFLVEEKFGLSGVLVLDASSNGPAGKAGLQSTKRDAYGRLILGDIITSVNGTKVTNGSDLYRILDQCKVGETVTVEVLRGDHKEKIHVILEPKPNES